jgi:hypothetical protein
MPKEKLGATQIILVVWSIMAIAPTTKCFCYYQKKFTCQLSISTYSD